jgi:pSer/pThr/pTyr-binding forkhead associated (FHA) protein
MAYRLQKSVTTLGRHPHSDVVIHKSFDTVSREHAQIRYEHGRYVLYDTSSRGTWVNGQRVNRKTLQDGDQISLAGQVSFVFSNGALHRPETERFAPAPTRRAAPSPSAPQRPAYPQHHASPRSGGKERVTAALLALLLGGIGAHKFYLGKTAEGILYLLFSWTGIPAIIALIEGIQYLSMTDEAFDYQFNR